MKRKILIFSIVLCLTFFDIVCAEDYSDKDAWDVKCENNQSSDCEAYRTFVEMEKIREQMDEIKKNIEANNDLVSKEIEHLQEEHEHIQKEYENLVSEYYKQIVQIDNLEDKAVSKDSNIENNEVLIETVKQNLLQQIKKYISVCKYIGVR